MRIPGGDLVPTRNRRYGGNYGRRRRRNRRRLLALVLLLVIAGGAAWYLRRDDAAAPTRVSTLPTCAASPSPAARAKPPVAAPRALPPAKVTLSVLNGTNHALLAKRVADQLAADGFHVTGQGNAPAAVYGASQVVYGPNASAQALTASAWVPGSVVVPGPRARPGTVQVVLGSGFIRLATPAEAAVAARRGTVPTAAPTPSATASVLPCRS